jgi:hypothetical protein
MKYLKRGRARRLGVALAAGAVSSLGLATGAMADTPPRRRFRDRRPERRHRPVVDHPKSGPVISRDTNKIAWVIPNPGYAPDPGHPGTGTVMAITVCGGGPPNV